MSLEDDSQANKKRRISSETVGEPSTASLATGSQPVVAPQEVPDEDNAAPPSTAAGAHARPLSALFAGPAPAKTSGSPVKMGKTSAGGGKGKAKAVEGEGEGFEDILARLQEGGESAFCSLVLWWAALSSRSGSSSTRPSRDVVDPTRSYGRVQLRGSFTPVHCACCRLGAPLPTDLQTPAEHFR